MTYGEPIKGEKYWQAAVLLALVLLFVTLSQPIWRGDEMLAELKSDCQKVGGVMLEHKKMFGTSYQCAERLDR